MRMHSSATPFPSSRLQLPEHTQSPVDIFAVQLHTHRDLAQELRQFSNGDGEREGLGFGYINLIYIYIGREREREREGDGCGEVVAVQLRGELSVGGEVLVDGIRAAPRAPR